MTVDVEQLVSDHKKAIHTTDGIEFHSVPSLLSQMRDAVHGGSAQDGAGAGGKTKLPFQAAAFDLYNLIETQVWEVHRAAFNKVMGAVHPETLLVEWAAWATTETIVTINGRNMYAPAAVAQWIQAIEDYLDPPRLAPIELPCPACGERYEYRAVDGEEVRSAALAFRRDRNTGDTLDARCGPCGVVWLPSQFMFFTKALAAGVSRPQESVEGDPI
jgi:hypothetical protein